MAISASPAASRSRPRCATGTSRSGSSTVQQRSIRRPRRNATVAMTIDVERLDGNPPLTCVALAGELDASNYEQVIDVVKNAYADGARGLVLDLEGLTFM